MVYIFFFQNLMHAVENLSWEKISLILFLLLSAYIKILINKVIKII